MGRALQQVFVASLKLPLRCGTMHVHQFHQLCKYVLKYVHKGCDQANFALRSDQVDEISDYQNVRYISSSEAAWRILEFQRFPPVQQLAVHLENGRRVYFTEDTARD